LSQNNGKNYRSALRNISEEWRSHMAIWLCSPEQVQSYMVWYGAVQHFIQEFKMTSHI